MWYNSLLDFNLGDDETNQSETEPLQINKRTDDMGEKILSFEKFLFRFVAYCYLL
jgi:hypothetical protein